MIMWNHNVLHYIVLDEAIQYDDVGLMEDMLLHLLFWFAGGHNNKYTVEVLEFLQGLQWEWPLEVRYVT